MTPAGPEPYYDPYDFEIDADPVRKREKNVAFDPRVECELG
jgi:hypothetical protein